MNTFRLVIALAVLAFAGAASAQDGVRGSTPPGKSHDGAAPSDGAIKGGSILPGESGGIPDDAKTKARCEELLGTLREDCLKQERERAAAGGTKDPARVLEPIDTRTRSPERGG